MSGKADATLDRAAERWTTQLAGALLLVAATAGLLGQGAYYASVQRPIGVLVAVATLLGLATWPPTSDELRLLPVVPALALAAWAVGDGALLGVAGAGVGPALLLVGLVAVLLVCRRLRQEDREVLLAGLIGVGLLVALTGWLGVAGRAGWWAFESQGLWRASATLTYPNATAAVLTVVSLVVLGRLVGTPGSVPLALAATGLLAGLGATMSRAGALGLVVGLVVLAGLRGLGATARATAGPVAGALVALAWLLPSMPAASRPRPVLAAAGLCAGLALAAIAVRSRRWPMLARSSRSNGEATDGHPSKDTAAVATRPRRCPWPVRSGLTACWPGPGAPGVEVGGLRFDCRTTLGSANAQATDLAAYASSASRRRSASRGGCLGTWPLWEEKRAAAQPRRSALSRRLGGRGRARRRGSGSSAG